MPDVMLHGNWINSMDRKMPVEDWNNFETEPPMPAPADHFREATKKVERGRAIAEEALHTINGERQDAYGNPEDTFFRIACLWSSYLGREVEGSDVANMMILLKIAREKEGKGKKDNYVDILGYAMLGASMRGYDA